MNFKTNIVFPVLTIVLFLLFLEFIFYFLPVSGDFDFNEVNEENQIFHAKKNNNIITSRFWDFYNPQKISINNYGFRSIRIIIKINKTLFQLSEIPMLKQFR